jgi:hypothetical protein
MTKTPYDRKWDNIKIVHVVMSGLGAILFAVGGILLRAVPGRYAVRVHYCTQLFGLVLSLVGFGAGVWLAIQNDQVCVNLLRIIK